MSLHSKNKFYDPECNMQESRIISTVMEELKKVLLEVMLEAIPQKCCQTCFKKINAMEEGDE